jgi:hypothetical protein
LKLNLWRYWLPLCVLAVFLTRCLYEINPLQFALLGDWLILLPVLAIALLAGRIIRRFTARGNPDWLPPDLSSLWLLGLYVVWPSVDLQWALILLIGAALFSAQAYLLPRRPRWFDIGLALVVLALYLLTQGDHVGRADTFEFQVVAPQLGIAHPTGYPLYVLLGKLFSLLPIGSLAWRVNLSSAICATGAIWLIYRTIILLRPDRLTAALTVLLLAASPVLWSQAVVAEVYALNALFVAALLGLLVILLLGVEDRRRRIVIYGVALLLGLSLSHHLTGVIVIPAIVLTAILVRPSLPLKHWLIAGGLFLLGLTPWLFILLRWPALHNGQWMLLSEWLGWIWGQRFGGALNLGVWLDSTRWSIMGRILVEQVGPIGLGLAAVGVILLIKQNWRIALITSALMAGYVFYGLVYNVPDVAVFVLPAFLVMAIWIGVTLAALPPLLNRLPLEDASRAAARTALYMLLTLLPLWQIAGHIDQTNQRGVGADHEAWGRYVLGLPIPPKAALLVDGEKIAPLYYLQVSEQLRPDLDIVVLGDETLYRQELDRRLASGQPVYLARFLPNLPYRMRSLGPLVEVSTRPQSTPPDLRQTLDGTSSDTIKLLGVTPEPGRPYRLTLYWQALSEQRPNYHVRLRLIDARGEVWWEDPGAHPVGGYYPTGAWAAQEVVADFHEVPVPPDLPAGTYALEAGLFTPFRDDGLMAGGSPWVKVVDVQVLTAREAPLPVDVRMVYEQTALMALSELGTIPPESQTALQVKVMGEGTSASLLLVRDRNIYSEITTTLRPGDNRLRFTGPEFVGDYEVHLLTGRPARCRWLAEMTPSCLLSTLSVAGEAPGDSFNFDNQVILLDAQIDRDTVQPGETLQVDLTWQGLKTWPGDYTAFVHLIGPDGKVHGQVDQWPMQGTLPTTQWMAGQVVDDPYTLTLPPDAPRGKYQVEVGWYLLATLRRLNVLDAAGRPSADQVIVGEFTVP